MAAQLVVARFSLPKSLFSIAVCSLVIVLLAFEAIVMVRSWHSGYASIHGRFWVYYIALGLALSCVMAVLLLTLLAQLVFFNRRAIWLDNENLVYLSPWFLRIPRREIQTLFVGSFGRYGSTGISVQLRHGQVKWIPTGALSERPEVVLERLKQQVPSN